MEQQLFLSLTPEELINLVEQGVLRAQQKALIKESTIRTYSINKAAKVLGRSHTTVKRLIVEGKIKTSANGQRRSEQALNNYLGESG